MRHFAAQVAVQAACCFTSRRGCEPPLHQTAHQCTSAFVDTHDCRRNQIRNDECLCSRLALIITVLLSVPQCTTPVTRTSHCLDVGTWRPVLYSHPAPSCQTICHALCVGHVKTRQRHLPSRCIQSQLAHTHVCMTPAMCAYPRCGLQSYRSTAEPPVPCRAMRHCP